MSPLLTVLKSYQKRRITRDRAAKMLGISPREVNRAMKEKGMVRERAPYLIRKEAAEKTREKRLAAARRAKKHAVTVKAAATQAGCSERTIRRFMERV